MQTTAWKLWVDTGGTFTDCLAQAPDGTRSRYKVLSSSHLRGRLLSRSPSGDLEVDIQAELPDHFAVGQQLRWLTGSEQDLDNGPLYKIESHVGETIRLDSPIDQPIHVGAAFEIVFDMEAPVLGAHLATQTPCCRPLPPIDLILATTRGTNALLEDRGAEVTLFITEGHEDLLLIGDQKRPDLFALNIERPSPLTTRVVPVKERIGADGEVVMEMELPDLSRPKGLQSSAAVALLNSYRNPIHEKRLCQHLKQAGWSFVSCSSELAASIKILPRAETAVVDAYLDPIMSSYLDGVAAHLRGGQLLVMSSAGGLVPRADYRAKDSLLSGPAGGVVGAARVGAQAGYEKVLGFDMGGTSSDVSRFDGEFEYHFEHRVGRARVMAPVLNIETVAAGGGSICGFDGEQLFVGPQSAGASPGPACYGAGGPLTVTDVNLLLGRLKPEGLGIPIDLGAAQLALNNVIRNIKQPMTEAELLNGFLNIANERMADAVGKRSVAAGVAPCDYALVAFGGAGGQHACAIADKLGVSTVLCPEEAGLLSASGLRVAVLERFAEESVLKEFNDVVEELPDRFESLSQQALGQLMKEGCAQQDLFISRLLISLRHLGQEACEIIDYDDQTDCIESFREVYEKRFGYWPEDKPIEVVSLRVVASSEASPLERESFHSANNSVTHGPVVHRSDLVAGMNLQGPILVQDAFCSVYIDQNWSGVVGSLGTIKLKQRYRDIGMVDRRHGKGGLVEQELFRSRFQSIVDDMGEMLRRTSVSTNVKERMDYSCALLDCNGLLLTNAPHIPVHLGALGLCVRSMMSEFEFEHGDMIVTNHPGHGGSHLPDVTVISPIFDVDGDLLAFVANRAHHAEMGGICPGSMPPQAKSLAEEGVVIAPMYLYKAGVANFSAIEKLLAEHPWPSRSIDDNLADLKAQAAANLLGVRALIKLCKAYGSKTVQMHMASQFDCAAGAIERRLRALGEVQHQCSESLDDGTQIHASMEIRSGKMLIDFSGTQQHHFGHFNATPAIVRSAVIYVLRLLVDEPVALNEGLFECVELRLPQCFLNPHFPKDINQAPPVVGGNVETSQRLVNLLLKPFAIVAGSQGTMNNLIFGNDQCSYYETIGGGCGAGPDFTGASAVHSHMTNTAITDPEILELRFPVRLEAFGLRRRSGGEGYHRGGDGIVRQLFFKEAVTLSLLTQHRHHGPYGLAGGEDGSRGEQVLIKADGERVVLGATVQESLSAGDRLVMKTPGGGGFGSSESL